LARCRICGQASILISSKLRVCLDCIRTNPEEALEIGWQAHVISRKAFDLPEKPPNTPNGLQCGQCANNCKIAEGQKGYCGLVENREGKLERYGGTVEKGILQWYYDPLPTNCVSWWFCPGCTGSGYPRFAHNPGAERGYSNLAVFYGSCSTDCLFCQNWHYRSLAQKHEPTISATHLAAKVHDKTSCICFFGGDPSTQMPHALKTAKLALAEASEKRRILRMCWETNGRMRENYAKQAAALSLMSGGNIKFDIKTHNETLSRILCGTTNKETLHNFQKIAEEYYSQRSELPILTASTLLIPGYIDTQEIEDISKFVAEIDPRIPYTLLAFYPSYILDDLPTTTRKQADACYEVAKQNLENVRIGNTHLLS